MDPAEVQVFTAAPASIQPLVFEAMEGLDQDTRHFAEEPAEVFRAACLGLEAIRDARLAFAQDPSLTEPAAIIKTADLADRKISEFTKLYDAAHAKLKSQIASHKAELAKPLEALTHSATAAELRSIVRAMPPTQRTSLIHKAINEGDKVLLSSLLPAHSLLTGIEPAQAAIFTHAWNTKTNPLISKRLAVLEKMLDVLGAHGHTMSKVAESHIGAPPAKVNALRAAAARSAKAFAR